MSPSLLRQESYKGRKEEEGRGRGSMTPNERTTEAEKILDVGHDREAPLHPSYSLSFFLGGPQSRGGEKRKKSDLAGAESKKMMGGGGDLSPGNEEESSSPKTFRHGVCKKKH